MRPARMVSKSTAPPRTWLLRVVRFRLASEVAMQGTVSYLRPLLVLAAPLTFLGYGPFLLSNPRRTRLAA
jgi:hypothetical protein